MNKLSKSWDWAALCLLFTLSFFPFSSRAQTVTCVLPVTLLNGTVADATQVMANFNQLVSCIGSRGVIVNTNAAVKALTAGVAPIVGRAAFSTPGDTKGVLFYYWSAVPCSFNSGAGDNGYQIAPNAGVGCWILIPPSSDYDPTWWGADATGNVNSVTAVQATVAAALINGAKVKFPCGTFLVTSSAAEVMKATSLPFGITGSGQCTIFTGTLGATTDLIHVVPSAFVRGGDFGNFAVTATGGQALVHIDCGAQSVFEVRTHDIQAVTATSKYGFWSKANSNNTNGCQVHSEVSWNTFNAPTVFTTDGIRLEYDGDTIDVHNNILTGNGIGIYSVQCLTAGGLVSCGNLKVQHNNITAFTSAIFIDGGAAPLIQNNEIELTGASGTGAMISLASSIAAVDGARILNNQMQAVTGFSGLSEAIFLAGGATPSINTLIDGNRLAASSAVAQAIADGAGATAILGYGNTFVNFTSQTSGTGFTVGVNCAPGSPTASFSAALGLVTHC